MPITSRPAAFFGHLFTTRKIVTAFMDYFSQRIYIERYSSDGSTYRYIQVPIQYAIRERFFHILKDVNMKNFGGGDATLELDLNRVLPRMSLSVSNMIPDTEKRLNKFGKLKKTNYNEDTETRDFVPTGVPISLDLELNIITKSQDDTFQILEQLIPYFGSTFSLDVNILDGYESESISFSVNSIQPDQNDEFGVDDERIFIGIINFTAKANYYYSRVDLSSQEYIRQIRTGFHVGKGADESYRKFKEYQLTADNLTPIEGLEEQPSTTTVLSEPFAGVFTPAFNSAFK